MQGYGGGRSLGEVRKRKRGKKPNGKEDFISFPNKSEVKKAAGHQVRWQRVRTIVGQSRQKFMKSARMSGEIPVLINALVKAFCAPSKSDRKRGVRVCYPSEQKRGEKGEDGGEGGLNQNSSTYLLPLLSKEEKASEAISEKSGKKHWRAIPMLEG